MHKASQAELGMAFPPEYLQKFKQYRKQRGGLIPRPRRRNPSASPKIFSSNCKQGISLARVNVYCCVLKEPVEVSVCKICPYHEPEPLDYTLYKRV